MFDAISKKILMAKVTGIDLGTTNSCMAVIAGSEPSVSGISWKSLLNFTRPPGRRSAEMASVDSKGRPEDVQRGPKVANSNRTMWWMQKSWTIKNTEVKRL